MLGFHGTAPTAQRTDASQVAVTDNSTGTVSDTVAAGVGVMTVSIPVNLASITGTQDILTTYTPGYKFKILALDFAVNVPVTTGSKLASINAEIGTTNLTGGVIALTSANCTPMGAVVAGSAITAANTGSAADTISFEAASVTAFSEGSGEILMKIQNMDTADAIASLSDKSNEWRLSLVNKGLISGAA